MINSENVINHLQIMHTWATVDLQSPKEPIASFRVLEDVKQWTMDAIELFEKQEEEIKTLSAYARAEGIDVDALLGRKVRK